MGHSRCDTKPQKNKPQKNTKKHKKTQKNTKKDEKLRTRRKIGGRIGRRTKRRARESVQGTTYWRKVAFHPARSGDEHACGTHTFIDNVEVWHKEFRLSVPKRIATKTRRYFVFKRKYKELDMW